MALPSADINMVCCLSTHSTSTWCAVSADSKMRETALIRAAHNGHLSVVEHLIQSGADISARDLVGGQPKANCLG